MRNNCIKTMVILAASWFAANTNSIQAQTVDPLISLSTTWRYNQTGTNLGTAWQATNYNDTVAGWEGPGLPLFGFESDEVQYNNLGVTFNTRFPDPQVAVNYRTNYYFRTHFTMPNYPAGILAATTLRMTNWYDDGVVYYLNGSELLRTNMPTGTITATTFAAPQPGEPNQVIISITPTNLHVGDNVLAVELHQINFTSSDEVFGMVMDAVGPVPLAITSQPSSRTNQVAETNATFSVAFSGSGPYFFHWYSNSVLIANATTNSYTAPTPAPGVINYYVSISNLVGSVATSDTVTLTIVPDTFAPTLLSAVAGPPPATRQSNQVDVTFSELVDNTPVATDPNSALGTNHYTISILGTTNTLPVISAQVNGALVRLTTTTFLYCATNYYVLTVNGVADKHANIIAPNSQISIGCITPVFNIFPISQVWNSTSLGFTGVPLADNWASTNFTEDLDLTCSNSCWYASPGIWAFENTTANCAGGTIFTGTLSQGYYTYYFRTRFVAPTNTLASGDLYLTNFFDDGVIYYLNGTEVFRTNMVLGAITYTNTSTISNHVACSFVRVSVTNLMMPPPATNVFAVELHENGINNYTGDNEIYFGMSLSYSNSPARTGPLPPSINIARVAASTNIISWTTNVAGHYWGLDAATNLNSTWTSLSNNGAPVRSPYTNTIGTNKYFRLRAR